MIKINELKKGDIEQFFIEIVEQHGVEHAISCITSNAELSGCLQFRKTCNESYWVNLWQNGYAKVEMTIKEIEEKLDMEPNTLKVIPF